MKRSLRISVHLAAGMVTLPGCATKAPIPPPRTSTSPSSPKVRSAGHAICCPTMWCPTLASPEERPGTGQTPDGGRVCHQPVPVRSRLQEFP